LLALDARKQSVEALEVAAHAAALPLKVIRDTYAAGREQYGARFIPVRPDQYVAWAADSAPADARALFARVSGS
jgi:hypothetical protein